MNNLQIQCFLAAVKNGSFTKAANELFISQSAFSKQIKKIETELGVSLFVRSNSRVVLTQAGGIVKPFAEQVNDAYNQLIKDLASLSPEETINVGVLPLMLDYKIFDVLCRFQENTDNPQININEASQPEVIRDLFERKNDFAILRLDYLSQEHFEITPIITDRFVFIASAKYSEMFAKKPYNLSKLETIPFVLIGKNSDIYTRCEEIFDNYNFRPKKIITTSRHLHMLSIVNSGAAIGIIPEGMVNLQMFPQLQIFDFIRPEKTSIGLVKFRKHNIPLPAQRLFRYITNLYERK